MADLSQLRAELDQVDEDLIAKAAARQRIVGEIGKLKRAQGRQLRDYAREREVLDRAERNALKHGLQPALAQQLLQQLIEVSLAAQEQDRVRSHAAGSGRRALVIGGGGRMGRWVAQFLDAQGYEVTVADPRGTEDAFQFVPDWTSLTLDHDLIVVAAQLRTTAEILSQLAERRPGGVVFDIGSLKSPLRDGFDALRRAGVRVTSVHPMFGPSANMLAGRHVVFVDLGVPEANAFARELFAQTTAVSVTMGLEEHDRLVGYVLGLSHALNIAFFTALAESGELSDRLAQLSSTTFDRQLAIARGVAEENPHLYYEIQHLNPSSAQTLSALASALDRVRGAAAGDEDHFVRLMQQGRAYLSGRRDHPIP